MLPKLIEYVAKYKYGLYCLARCKLIAVYLNSEKIPGCPEYKLTCVPPPPCTPTIRIGVEYRNKDANGRSSARLHLAESIAMNTYRITHKAKSHLLLIYGICFMLHGMPINGI